MAWRKVARRAVGTVGLDGPALRVLEHMQPARRRDRLDNERLIWLMAFVLRRDSSVLDIGANVGEVLTQVVRIAPGGRHIAYEPLPDLAQSLASRFPDVEIRNAAASDEAGESTFMRDLDSHGHSGMRIRPDTTSHRHQKLVVRTERLDDALPRDFAPTLMKIDVEGAEGLVLRGATRVLQESRPWVWFEHGGPQAAVYGTSSQDIHGIFDGLGMRIFDADGRGPYSARDFRNSPSDMWTYLAH